MNISYPDMTKSSIISFDIETYDPELMEKGPGVYRRDGNILGVSLADNLGHSEYYNLGHKGIRAEEKKRNYAYIKEVLALPIKKVGANCQYDVDWLENWANVKVNGDLHDIQIAEPLIDENLMSYSLDSLAKKYLDKGKFKDEIQEWCTDHDLKGDPRKWLWMMPYKLVREYAVVDAEEPVEIFAKQWEVMKEQHLLNVYHIEIGITRLLLQMRRAGVRIDTKYVNKTIHELTGKINEAEKYLYERYGKFNYNSSAQVAKIFDKLNIDYRLTAKGNPSITADDLELIDHGIAKHIMNVKKLKKARDTFFINTLTESRVGDRIHSTFLPIKRDDGGTVTGRFSCKNPNLQQIPSRDKYIGPLCRRAFIPEEDCDMLKIDWSQIEYRIIAHFASGRGSDEIREAYNNEPKTDYHAFVMGLTGLDRKPAKNLNFGAAYFMGVKTCAVKFHWTLEESKAFLELYHNKVPFVRATGKQVSDVAKGRGFIKTIAGRRSRVTDEMRKNKKEFVMFNHLVQGTAADIMKMAMKQAYDEGIFETLIPHITVHDELVCSMPRTEEGREAGMRLKEVMETCVKLKVPIIADAEIGPNWHDVVDFVPEEL
jgi:DNA polymerase I-like protein with 3'-5' exonuclease and polymerase domains